MKEKSSSPLFNANNEDNEDRAINSQEVINKHSNENKNASNGQMLHPINVTSQSNNVSHNQISAAANNTFNRTIGSRQSSPTNEAGVHLHSTQSVNSEKINNVNISNVQNSGGCVSNSVTNESSLNSTAGSIPSDIQQGSAASAQTQQINIDTSGFPGQVLANQ